MNRLLWPSANDRFLKFISTLFKDKSLYLEFQSNIALG